MCSMFLDRDKTLSTCKETNCKECSVSDKLVCHFNSRQLALFLGMSGVVFILAGVFIYLVNTLFLIPWILSCFIYFGFLEIRVMCSHCPHYAEPSLKSLHCWANYGSPKIWKYRPGPMSFIEKLVFLIGLFWILLYPLGFLLFNKLYVYGSIYTIALIIWKVLLRVFFCSRCINPACPFNAVKSTVRNDFIEKNPMMKNAWHSKK